MQDFSLQFGVITFAQIHMTLVQKKYDDSAKAHITFAENVIAISNKYQKRNYHVN